MRPLTMLVTSEGEWVFERSPEFLTALGDPEPDYDSTLFAVKNLGFIRFETVAREIVEIELHPRNVELPALLAVQQQLISSHFKLFRIKYFEETWCSEITSSAEEAISRLSELCAPAFSPPPSDRFFVEPQDWSSLSRQEESPLRFLFQKWRMSFGYFDSSLIPFAIQHEFLRRLMIAGIKNGEDDPVFRFIGDGFNWLQEEYQFYGLGERLQDLPDKEYGGWVAEYYKSVARTGQPRYDMVTAAIETGPRMEKVFKTRYERLLLPWKTRSSEVFVTLLSRTLPEETSARVIRLNSVRPFDRKIRKSS
jgi:hypothetical protein